MKLFKIILILSFFYACSKKQKPDFLQPKEFADVYIEFLLSTTKDVTVDSLAQTKKILSRHNITIKEYNETIEYYQNHPELWLKTLKIVVQKLEHQTKSTKHKK